VIACNCSKKMSNSLDTIVKLLPSVDEGTNNKSMSLHLSEIRTQMNKRRGGEEGRKTVSHMCSNSLEQLEFRLTFIESFRTPLLVTESPVC